MKQRVVQREIPLFKRAKFYIGARPGIPQSQYYVFIIIMVVALWGKGKVDDTWSSLSEAVGYKSEASTSFLNCMVDGSDAVTR